MQVVRTVLVTGGAGYVGSVLVPKLLGAGYRVKVLDLYLYGDEVLAGVRPHVNLQECKGDLRDRKLLARIVPGCDAVVHLACISNDPSFELDSDLGRAINYEAFTPLVDICRDGGVRRFVFASSSSVYGIKQEENVTEDLPLTPLTDYSKYKAICEEILLKKRAPGFTTLILRPATVCGYSPRMRLDLTVNILTNHAVNARVIKVFGGEQMRPNIHIEDMADLYVRALQWPDAAVDGKILNAGYYNYRVREIAEIVRKAVGDQVEIVTIPTDDNRSYHISSERIKRELGFVPTHSVEEAVRDLVAAFRAGRIPDAMTDDRYYNIKRMQRLQLKWPTAFLGVTSMQTGEEIPYVDLPRQHAAIKAELMAAVSEVLDDAHFILGDAVAEFEGQFAKLCGVRYAIGVNSGTDALILALKALGVGSGDEVITAPNSFVASAACIRLVGARPVFVDVGPDYNIDPEKLPAAVTSRTKAVLPVHLTGRPCAMDPIVNVARKYGLHVIEDAAQAVCGEYRGRRVGSFGTIGCFSLHPLKTLNACGDGGVLTTDDPELYDRLKIMRNIGLRTRDDCILWSQNSRLDTIQAAILLVKLRYVEVWTERRRENARYYRARLVEFPHVEVPNEEPGTRPVYHTFVIQGGRRDELRAFLKQRGIHTAIHYPVPIHLSTAGRELGYPEGSFPVAERQARRILSLPVYPELTTAQLERVCDAIQTFYSDPQDASR